MKNKPTDFEKLAKVQAVMEKLNIAIDAKIKENEEEYNAHINEIINAERIKIVDQVRTEIIENDEELRKELSALGI